MQAFSDPVCGMTVDPARPKGGSYSYNGTTYGFCNPGCRAKFIADPEKYLAPKPNPPEADSAKGLYTCPMHPEIRQEGPGSCPICGMALEPLDLSEEGDNNPELKDMSIRLGIAVAFALPLVVLDMSRMLAGWPPLAMRLEHQVELGLASPVVLLAGWPLIVRFFQSLKNRSPNMFTLIGLGTAAAFIYSALATIAPQIFPLTLRGMDGEPNVYFEASAVIVTLVLLGQVLELRARRQTSGALRALLTLAPKTARRIKADGEEIDVPISHIQPGDRLRVRPGERVPTDGVVVEGQSAVDESLMTGESIPVAKGPGTTVTGGTINGSGGFVMEARRVGSETVLAQIVRMVSEAQRSRAPIQRLADRVSAYFVPAVIGVAGLTALAWGLFGPAPRLAFALVNAVAVLIVACPCALGLATPMSIMVGVGRGARSGVLVRTAEALELLQRVDVLLLDKTGTLTEGHPRLTTVLTLPDFTEQEVLEKAATLERSSEHPVGAAIVRAAEDRGLRTGAVMTDFESFPGQGIQGRFDGRLVRLGSAPWLEQCGVDLRMLRDRADRQRRSGETVIFMASGDQPAAIFGVADPIKANAAEVLEALRAQNLALHLVTGDHPMSARAVAERLGIPATQVHSEVAPEQKIALVRELQAAGKRVAMAGDGINDGPALAQADVGIAMGSGTDVAIQSAGIALLGGNLMGLVRARRLSRGVMRNIRQNLFFAFVYNFVGVPIAAGLLYPFFGILLSPIVASAAMSFSSVSVIGNALRLRKLRL